MARLLLLRKLLTVLVVLLGTGLAAYWAVVTYRSQQGLGTRAATPLPEFLDQLPDNLRFRELDSRIGKTRSVSLALSEVNSAQMVNYIWGGFQPSFAALGVTPTVVGYKFELEVTPQQSITRALPTQDFSPSFIGAVVPDGDRVFELRCQSIEPRRVSLAPPVLESNQLVCGPDSVPLATASTQPTAR
ncbi:hypothetical protein [Synechococcus elongatus]|uniref:Uncharacterized protein n=1 Tax=Synechococcus sp. (strain ATCC 27144 / PCC 6301 / SAUG 1402/1) TaxID=269084 RepID=A0A0H3K8Z6_SYNP6|nr:hypothetical protein [Synechococcus elongatus]MBD2687624.1 hypothetical protein [Synechococcus elongatus FACHB-1061]AJD57681.1 hypothetical protein M744_07450 [Synechococcus elongatus UTEX 2973]MBD2586550.1 hypothetical protein [Synechococcus elongatus FACHB-242]MBD2706667.1 hypothetical protein [Synechococcus elongatus PCC 7942 = FACHB-805]UOW71624.1 hypothetical protein PCC7943_1878 [Synechococcus elongatus PCC 7943]